jgi:hypothetical protein
MQPTASCLACTITLGLLAAIYYSLQKTDDFYDTDPSCWVGLVSPHPISTQQTCQQAAGEWGSRHQEVHSTQGRANRQPPIKPILPLIDFRTSWEQLIAVAVVYLLWDPQDTYAPCNV